MFAIDVEIDSNDSWWRPTRNILDPLAGIGGRSLLFVTALWHMKGYGEWCFKVSPSVVS